MRFGPQHVVEVVLLDNAEVTAMRLVNAFLDLLEELLGDGAQLLRFFQFVEPDECLEIQLCYVG